MGSISTRFRAAGFMALALGAVFALAMPVAGQDADERDSGRRGRPNFRNMSEEERKQFFERMRERMEQRREEQLQQALRMSDEEFAAVNPMIETIRRRKAERGFASRVRPGIERDDEDGDRRRRGRGRGRGRPGFGPGGFPGFGGPDESEMSPEARKLRDRMRELREAVRDDSLPAEEVRSKLKAVRQARSRLNKTIDQAQDELRKVLLARQEATLVMMGVLD